MSSTEPERKFLPLGNPRAIRIIAHLMTVGCGVSECAITAIANGDQQLTLEQLAMLEEKGIITSKLTKVGTTPPVIERRYHLADGIQVLVSYKTETA